MSLRWQVACVNIPDCIMRYLPYKREIYKRNPNESQKKHKVGGYVQDITRYSKNCFYIDLDANRSIISLEE